MAAVLRVNDDEAELVADCYGTTEALQVLGLIHLRDHHALGLISFAKNQEHKKASPMRGFFITCVLTQAEPTPV